MFARPVAYSSDDATLLPKERWALRWQTYNISYVKDLEHMLQTSTLSKVQEEWPPALFDWDIIEVWYEG